MSKRFFFASMGAVSGGFTPIEPIESFISFLGDSTTEMGDVNYIKPVSYQLNMTPVNGGVGGSALGIGTNRGLDRYGDYIMDNGKYVVLIGINDIGGARTATEYESDLNSLVDGLLLNYQPSDIVICKIMWCDDIGGNFTYQKLLDFNLKVENVAINKGVKLCDMYTPFVNRHDLLSDGIHPNASGYEVMKNALLEVI